MAPMSKRRASSKEDQTQPSEIPTALIEDPYVGGDRTEQEERTLDSTPTTGSSTPSRWKPDKFRRPTESEIVDAVEQVKTDAVDVNELARASLERAEEDDEEEDEEEEDD